MIKNVLALALAFALVLGSISFFLMSVDSAHASSDLSLSLQDDAPKPIKTGYLYYASSDGAELQEWVMGKQKEGWICKGGMAPVYQHESKKWIYFQTMVKE